MGNPEAVAHESQIYPRRQVLYIVHEEARFFAVLEYGRDFTVAVVWRSGG